MRHLLLAALLWTLAIASVKAQVFGSPQVDVYGAEKDAAADAAKKADEAATADVAKKKVETAIAEQAKKSVEQATVVADDLAKKAREAASEAAAAAAKQDSAAVTKAAKAVEAAADAATKQAVAAAATAATKDDGPAAAAAAEAAQKTAQAAAAAKAAQTQAHADIVAAAQQLKGAAEAAEAALKKQEEATRAAIKELDKRKAEETLAAAEAEKKAKEAAKAEVARKEQEVADASVADDKVPCPKSQFDYKVVFPARTPRLAQCFFDAESKVLGAAELTLFSNGGSFYAELYHGVAGPMRLGFSVLAEKTTTPSAAAQPGAAGVPSADNKLSAGARFLQNGGNASAIVHYPVLFFPFWKTSYMSILAFARAAGDVPGLGGTSDNPAIESEVGTAARLMLLASPGNIGFKLEARITSVYGTDQFLANVGRANKNLFGVVQLSGGIVLGDTVEIRLTGVPGAPADVRPSLPSLMLTTSLINK